MDLRPLPARLRAIRRSRLARALRPQTTVSEDVARDVTFLHPRGNRHTTGSVLVSDGGLSLASTQAPGKALRRADSPGGRVRPGHDVGEKWEGEASGTHLQAGLASWPGPDRAVPGSLRGTSGAAEPIRSSKTQKIRSAKSLHRVVP